MLSFYELIISAINWFVFIYFYFIKHSVQYRLN